MDSHRAVMPKLDLGKSGPGVQFWLPKTNRGSIFGCQNWTCLAKNGPVLVAKKGPVHFWQAAKSGPV